jgi:hypothetical protein
MGKKWVFSFVFFGLFCLSIISTGCSSNGWVPQWSGSGFIRKEFLDYRRAAVLPFEGDAKGEVSNVFARAFQERFTKIELVGRGQLLKDFREQDLNSNQLNQAVRRKIGEVFGVQAIVAGSVYYPSILRWLLQIQIIDVETGEVIGRSLVEINFAGAERVEEACKIAVQYLTPN